MTAQVTTKILLENPATITLHVFLLSDGVTGELNNSLLISPAMLTPPLYHSPCLRIMRIWYSAVWFDTTISFGGETPRPIWVLARDTKTYVDFARIGGLADDNLTPPIDENGQILLSTNGFAPLGSQGSLIIEFKKNRQA